MPAFRNKILLDLTVTVKPRTCVRVSSKTTYKNVTRITTQAGTYLQLYVHLS